MDYDVLDDFDKPRHYSDSDIFFKIWTEPRAVFTFLDEFEYDRLLVPLLFVGGIMRAFDRAVERDSGDTLPLLMIIAMSVLLGGLLGWIGYYLYAALISWTGKWLDGTGDTKSILRALAHALIPAVVGFLFFIVQLAIYGVAMFQSDGSLYSESPVVNGLFWGALGIEFALSLYSLVLSVIGVSVVQQLSIGKTILNMILPILVIIVPIALLAAGFSLL